MNIQNGQQEIIKQLIPQVQAVQNQPINEQRNNTKILTLTL